MHANETLIISLDGIDESQTDSRLYLYKRQETFYFLCFTEIYHEVPLGRCRYYKSTDLDVMIAENYKRFSAI